MHNWILAAPSDSNFFAKHAQLCLKPPLVIDDMGGFLQQGFQNIPCNILSLHKSWTAGAALLTRSVSACSMGCSHNMARKKSVVMRHARTRSGTIYYCWAPRCELMHDVLCEVMHDDGLSSATSRTSSVQTSGTLSTVRRHLLTYVQYLF